MKHCYFKVDITSDSKHDFLIGIKFSLFEGFSITPQLSRTQDKHNKFNIYLTTKNADKYNSDS